MSIDFPSRAWTRCACRGPCAWQFFSPGFLVLWKTASIMHASVALPLQPALLTRHQMQPAVVYSRRGTTCRCAAGHGIACGCRRLAPPRLMPVLMHRDAKSLMAWSEHSLWRPPSRGISSSFHVFVPCRRCRARSPRSWDGPSIFRSVV
jgi:hypothetical protein